jgi:hypothetical protein
MGEQVSFVDEQADGARPGEWRGKRGEQSDDFVEKADVKELSGRAAGRAAGACRPVVGRAERVERRWGYAGGHLGLC